MRTVLLRVLAAHGCRWLCCLPSSAPGCCSWRHVSCDPPTPIIEPRIPGIRRIQQRYSLGPPKLLRPCLFSLCCSAGALSGIELRAFTVQTSPGSFVTAQKVPVHFCGFSLANIEWRACCHIVGIHTKSKQSKTWVLMCSKTTARPCSEEKFSIFCVGGTATAVQRQPCVKLLPLRWCPRYMRV